MRRYNPLQLDHSEIYSWKTLHPPQTSCPTTRRASSISLVQTSVAMELHSMTPFSVTTSHTCVENDWNPQWSPDPMTIAAVPEWLPNSFSWDFEQENFGWGQTRVSFKILWAFCCHRRAQSSYQIRSVLCSFILSDHDGFWVPSPVLIVLSYKILQLKRPHRDACGTIPLCEKAQ